MSEPSGRNVNDTLLRIEILINEMKEQGIDLTQVEGTLADIFNTLEQQYTEINAITTATTQTSEKLGTFSPGESVGSLLRDSVGLLNSIYSYLIGTIFTALAAIRTNTQNTAANTGSTASGVTQLVTNIGSESTSDTPNLYALMKQIRDDLATIPRCSCPPSMNDNPDMETTPCEEPFYMAGSGQIARLPNSPYNGQWYLEFAQLPSGWAYGVNSDVPNYGAIERQPFPQGIRIFVASESPRALVSTDPAIYVNTGSWEDVYHPFQVQLMVITDKPARAFICFPDGDPVDPEPEDNPENWSGSNYANNGHLNSSYNNVPFLFQSAGASDTRSPLWFSAEGEPKTVWVVWCGSSPLPEQPYKVERIDENDNVLESHTLTPQQPVKLSIGSVDDWRFAVPPIAGGATASRVVWGWHADDVLSRCAV